MKYPSVAITFREASVRELHRILFVADFNAIPDYPAKMMARYFIVRLANRLTQKLQNGIPRKGLKITLKHEDACALYVLLTHVDARQIKHNGPLTRAVVLSLV